jgi:hypothetical protein
MADHVGADTDALDPKKHQTFLDYVESIHDFTQGFPTSSQVVPIQRTDNDKAVYKMVDHVYDWVEKVHVFESELIFEGGWKVQAQKYQEQITEENAQDKGNKANEAMNK